MFGEDLNYMDSMDYNDQDSVLDIEGELRYDQANLNQSRKICKKVEEKIEYLRNLHNEGNKFIDDFEDNLDKKT